MFRPAPFAVVVFYFGLTVYLLRRLRVGVSREAAAGGARSILQLLVMGSVLMFVFRVDSRLLDALVLSAMIATAAFIAARRAGTRGGYRTSLAAVLAASVLVIGPMAALGVFELRSSFLVPIAGMVIGNAMNATALSLDRLQREMTTGRKSVEALLALGIDADRASEGVVRQSVRAALIPTLNSMKAIGVVHIPGMMTGMLLSGADPIWAAEMQAIILYLIFIGAVLSSLVATGLQRRAYFTPYEALRPLEGNGEESPRTGSRP